MKNSVFLLSDLKIFKKLCFYYLKRIIDTSFWVFVSLGVVWSVFSNFASWKALEVKEDYLRELTEINKEISFSLSEQKKKEISEKLTELTKKTIKKSFFGWVGANWGISNSLAGSDSRGIFWNSLIFSAILMFFPVIVEHFSYKQISTLLSLDSSRSWWKKNKPTKGENEMILAFTPGVNRFIIAISKFLAYLTRCLIINFVLFVLPYLLDFSNWTNHLGLLLTLLGLRGLILPPLFFSFSACAFYRSELIRYIPAGFIIIFFSIKPASEQLSKFSPELVIILGEFFSKISKSPLLPHYFSTVILLFDSLFFYLYYRDFKNADFS